MWAMAMHTSRTRLESPFPYNDVVGLTIEEI